MSLESSNGFREVVAFCILVQGDGLEFYESSPSIIGEEFKEL